VFRWLAPAIFVLVAFPLSPSLAGNLAAVRSLLEIRQDRVIVQKWETSCAAAALATVLTYSRNDPVSEKHVAQRMLRSTDPIKVKVRGGFSLLDMKKFVQSRGFIGTGYKNLQLGELLTLNAPIVPIDFYGNPHFIVVRGLTPDGKIDVADPAFGNNTVTIDEFKSTWKDGLAFVVSQ
jgi:uncharacterized protein